MEDYRTIQGEIIEIEVNGKDYLVEWFVGIRIDPATIPEGKHLYQTRHAEGDWGRPISITKGNVLMNFCGSVVTSESLCLEGETRSDSEIVLEHRAQIAHRKMIGHVRIQPNHRRGGINIVLAGKVSLIDGLAPLCIDIFRHRKEYNHRQKEKKMQQATTCHIFSAM